MPKEQHNPDQPNRPPSGNSPGSNTCIQTAPACTSIVFFFALRPAAAFNGSHGEVDYAKEVSRARCPSNRFVQVKCRGHAHRCINRGGHKSGYDLWRGSPSSGLTPHSFRGSLDYLLN
ncbi:hypothetical protein TNCT_243531 [Trichonephila clavata]|uniref:Uncharacterized protein n=1 Tax=Trichonephila clavata TaxID=2740835 RepID=A0A8X6LCZ9_TRICU|nr:hypothetical protein TNCT_243531 [Trichonephila clavata]